MIVNARQVEGVLGPVAGFEDHPVERVVPKGGDQAQSEVGLVVVERPADRDPEVVEVGVDGPGPGGFVGAAEPTGGFVGETGEVLGVAAGELVASPGDAGAFGAVLAQGLQQAVAGAALPVEGLDHGLVDEHIQQVQNVEVVGADLASDRGRAGQVESAGENRQPVEQALLVRRQQVVAPATPARSVAW